jgi:uncharacterized membrane protein
MYAYARRSPLDLLPAALAVAAAIVALLSLLDGESAWVRALVLAPALVACVPPALADERSRQRARAVVAVLLAAWCLVAIASAGLLYVPSAIAMAVLALRGRAGR